VKLPKLPQTWTVQLVVYRDGDVIQLFRPVLAFGDRGACRAALRLTEHDWWTGTGLRATVVIRRLGDRP
jgi:hypothetical protein